MRSMSPASIPPTRTAPDATHMPPPLLLGRRMARCRITLVICIKASDCTCCTACRRGRGHNVCVWSVMGALVCVYVHVCARMYKRCVLCVCLQAGRNGGASVCTWGPGVRRGHVFLLSFCLLCSSDSQSHRTITMAQPLDAAGLKKKIWLVKVCANQGFYRHSSKVALLLIIPRISRCRMLWARHGVQPATRL